MILQPPGSTLCPYTTLFRSGGHDGVAPGTWVQIVGQHGRGDCAIRLQKCAADVEIGHVLQRAQDRKSTRLNSSHVAISYAVFCLKKKKKKTKITTHKHRTHR